MRQLNPLSLFLPGILYLPLALGVTNTDPSVDANVDKAISSLTQQLKKQKQTMEGQSKDPEAAKKEGAQSTPSLTNASTPQYRPPARPQTRLSPQEAARESAFNALAQEALPMNPDEIRRLHRLYNATNKAAYTPAEVPPKPVTTSIMVSLAPGSTPPVTRLFKGFVTSLVILDSTGAPWPVESYDVGNPAAFDIQWNKTSNTLLIQSKKSYEYGNLAIKLRGLSTPVMVTLIPGQAEVDYRMDMRILGFGPNAQPGASNGTMPKQANPLLLSFLNGVAPEGAKVLQVKGCHCEAWSYGNTLYLRMRHKVLSPNWMATMVSADGTHTYEMKSTPMVLISRYGKPTPITITGY